ncbi:hypothetical protein OSTOST_23615 [Ostertagia ostertagi]
MSAIAVPIVSDSDPLKPERSAAADDTTDAQSTTSADSGNGSLNNSLNGAMCRTTFSVGQVENETTARNNSSSEEGVLRRKDE